MTTPKKKPARKAREWDVFVWENWSYNQQDIGSHAPSMGLQHTKIRVREILPPVRKKTTKGKKK